MKIRIIHAIKGFGNENVTFTEEFDKPAADFLYPGYHVYSDSVHDLDLPSSFPLEVTLEKR